MATIPSYLLHEKRPIETKPAPPPDRLVWTGKGAYLYLDMEDTRH